MNVKDKEICDKLIDDILQQPDNQEQFMEMLKHFQDFTGEEIDVEIVKTIFPKLWGQLQVLPKS